MTPWKATTAYLVTTLPRDTRLVLTVVASKKLQTCACFIGVLLLTVLVGVLAMWIVTGSLPRVAVNTEYWGLSVQRLKAVPARELLARFLETFRIYLDYPAIWFTFQRIGFEEQARTLAMDTTTAFPVLSLRYLLDNAPIALLLAVHLVLSRHRTPEMRTVQARAVSPVVSISLPGGSSAIASALAPMACCGGTVVQSAAYAVGFLATAPVATLFSRLASVGVGMLLVIGIAWTARKISASRSCVSPLALSDR